MRVDIYMKDFVYCRNDWNAYVSAYDQYGHVIKRGSLYSSGLMLTNSGIGVYAISNELSGQVYGGFRLGFSLTEAQTIMNS